MSILGTLCQSLSTWKYRIIVTITLIISIQCWANTGPLAKRHLNGVLLAANGGPLLDVYWVQTVITDVKWWSFSEFRSYVRYLPNSTPLHGRTIGPIIIHIYSSQLSRATTVTTAAMALTSLHKRSVSTEQSLLAHTKKGTCRWMFTLIFKPLAPVDSCAFMFNEFDKQQNYMN